MKKIILLILVVASLKGEVKSSEIVAECNGYLQKADEFMEMSIEKASRITKVSTKYDLYWELASTYANMSRMMQERYRICIIQLYNKEK